MERQAEEYTATQTEIGFRVEFHGSEKANMDLSFMDVEEFANKYNQEVLEGKTPELSEKEEVVLSLLKMMLISDRTIH